MAKIQKDLFGTYHVDVTEELSKARRDEQFRQDMSQIGSSVNSEMGRAARDGVLGTAALGVGAVAVGVGAVKNRRFRYKLQAVLHFPFVFFIAWAILLPIALTIFGPDGGGAEDATSMVTITVVCTALSAVISIVWSMIYINKRTKPKLARLGH